MSGIRLGYVRLGRRPGIVARGKREAIADYLFPNPPETDWTQKHGSTGRPQEHASRPRIHPHQSEEFLEVCKTLPAGKLMNPPV